MIVRSAGGPEGSTCYAPGADDPKDRTATNLYCDLAPLPAGQSVQVTTVLEQWRGDGDAAHGEVSATAPKDPDASNNTWSVQIANPSFEPPSRPLIPTASFPAPLAAPPANGTDRADPFTAPASRPRASPRSRDAARAGRGPGRLKVVDVPSLPLLFEGGPARLSDTVRATGRRTRRARVAYLLSADRRRDRGDVALKGSRRVPALKGGVEHTGDAKVTLPAKARPGRWYVLACLRRQCAASDYATAVGPKANPLDVTAVDVPGLRMHHQRVAPRIDETARIARVRRLGELVAPREEVLGRQCLSHLERVGGPRPQRRAARRVRHADRQRVRQHLEVSVVGRVLVLDPRAEARGAGVEGRRESQPRPVHGAMEGRRAAIPVPGARDQRARRPGGALRPARRGHGRIRRLREGYGTPVNFVSDGAMEIFYKGTAG